jgi:hypothetical protein
MLLAVFLFELAAIALTKRLPASELPHWLLPVLAAHWMFTGGALLSAGTRFYEPVFYTALGITVFFAGMLAIAAAPHRLLLLAALLAGAGLLGALTEHLERSYRGRVPATVQLHLWLFTALGVAGALALLSWFNASSTRPAFHAISTTLLGTLWLAYSGYSLAFLRGTLGPQRQHWLAINQFAPLALELVCFVALAFCAARAQAELSLAPAPGYTTTAPSHGANQ